MREDAECEVRISFRKRENMKKFKKILESGLGEELWDWLEAYVEEIDVDV